MLQQPFLPHTKNVEEGVVGDLDCGGWMPFSSECGECLQNAVFASANAPVAESPRTPKSLRDKKKHLGKKPGALPHK